MNDQVNKDNGTNSANNQTAKKPNFLVTTARKVKKTAEKLKKDHPILYKAGKLLSLAGAGYGAVKGIYTKGFNDGAKSVVPTTVYIQSGVEEDETDDVLEETQVEETNEEPAADELSEI